MEMSSKSDDDCVVELLFTDGMVVLPPSLNLDPDWDSKIGEMWKDVVVGSGWVSIWSKLDDVISIPHLPLFIKIRSSSGELI